MKKFISYFLIFAVSLANTPVHVFAQDFGYKPAVSFEYDYYEVGKVNPKKFIQNLEEDLLNIEQSYDPESVPPVSGKSEGTPEHLQQSYNDFLYYNIYPEESPLWNYTALIPDNGTQNADVLRILDYHHYVSEEISELFAQNKKYKQERREKWVRLIPSVIVQILLFFLLWEIEFPELLSTIVTYTGWNYRLSQLISMVILLPVDIWICDEAAFEMKNMDQRLNNLFQSVGMYRNTAIKVSAKTDLLKPVTEIEQERIKHKLKDMTKGSLKPKSSGDVWILKRYFKKGYSAIDTRDRMRLKEVLGKFLYDVFDGDEVLINEYFRKELLRTYYALKFIKDELNNTDDPLRYDRALIDMATTYKIQNIQVIDSRLFTRHNQSEVKSFGKSLQDIKDAEYGLDKNKLNTPFFQHINQEIDRQIGAELADQTSVANTYPTMLTRAEVNYLVQIMDIYQKKKDYDDNIKKQRNAQKNIEERVSKRAAQSSVEPDGWSLTK